MSRCRLLPLLFYFQPTDLLKNINIFSAHQFIVLISLQSSLAIYDNINEKKIVLGTKSTHQINHFYGIYNQAKIEAEQEAKKNFLRNVPTSIKKGAIVEMTCLIQMIPGNLENIYFISLNLQCHQLQDVPLFYVHQKKKGKKPIKPRHKLLNQLNYKMDPTFSNVKMFFFLNCIQ